jgi:hypothetical protein
MAVPVKARGALSAPGFLRGRSRPASLAERPLKHADGDPGECSPCSLGSFAFPPLAAAAGRP